MENIFRQVQTNIIFKIQRNVTYPAHIHEDIELIYVKKGSCTAFCDGRKYTLKENALFLAFPNQVHHYTECVPGEYYTLILKPTRLLGYGEIFTESLPLSAVCSPNPDAIYLLETAYDEFCRDGYSKIIAAYLTALFGKLLKHYSLGPGSLRQDTALQILNFCANHYRENISVADIADSLHISRSSISHIFSNRLGIHFCDYINALRLADAVELIRNGSYTMTEIAEKTGFPTIRTFNRAFFKQYGTAPSHYRKETKPEQDPSHHRIMLTANGKSM